ncbi:MAG: hypothetical protein ABEJ89_10360 [Haloarculaceae archaeon]
MLTLPSLLAQSGLSEALDQYGVAGIALLVVLVAAVVAAAWVGYSDRLGAAGVVGLLLVVAGVVAVAWVNILLGVGLTLVIAGLGFIVFGLVTNLMGALGMGGAMP